MHNTYQQRGGEDAVVEAEAELLRKHGHAVTLYRRSNDEVAGQSRLSLAAQSLWSTRTRHEIAALLQQQRPSIVHVHNTLPLVSPSVYWAAAHAGVPVVQTLHNYRLLCPQALMLRDNRVCEDCVGHLPWRAVRHRCYRGSATQSAVVAGTVQLHRWLGTWQHKVARYIALNEFSRQKFIDGGLPAERICVKPNFVDLPPPEAQPRSGFLFVGRMSVEKGIETLVAATRLLPSNLLLRAIGDGPLAGLLRETGRVELLGQKAHDEVGAEMARTTALVMPSIWYEPFGLVVIEAFASSLPVIASRIGAPATLVDDGKTGLLFEPGNAADLAEKIAWAQGHPEAMAAMGRQARATYEQRFTADINYRHMTDIYAQALAEHAAHLL
ncbi:MAG: glycosyltransferase family 4 protein [Rubrivivax sp.]